MKNKTFLFFFWIFILMVNLYGSIVNTGWYQFFKILCFTFALVMVVYNMIQMVGQEDKE